MRPRFSMRLLLIMFALVAFACYWAFVRPTVIAERFVDAVNHSDYQAAQSLFLDTDSGLLTGLREDMTAEVRAELLPREWRDVWRLQRRITYQLIFNSESLASRLRRRHQSDMLATTTGILATPLRPLEVLNFVPTDVMPETTR